jgi:putative ABC transport system permease protein
MSTWPAFRRTEVFVRAQGDVSAARRQVRTIAQSIDPELSVPTEPLEHVIAGTKLVTSARLASVFSAGLGGLALVLASMGLFGLLAYSVAQRAREIGIRLALGARRQDVAGLIVLQALRLVATGAILGAAIGAAASRVLSALLFGLSPFDPIAYGSVSSLLLILAILASYVPARRAARLDPLVSLRCE